MSLWANPIEPSDWGYPRHRDTRSRDYRIVDNGFTGNRVGVRVAATSNVGSWATGDRVDSLLVRREDSSMVTLVIRPAPPLHSTALPATPRAGGLPPNPTRLAGRDRSAIIVDEWGPYDWLSPSCGPPAACASTDDDTRSLRVPGPAGRWRVVSRRGIAQRLPRHR